MPEKPPPLHTDANADADANAANADASADASADADADADADANADANTDAYSDARVTSATLLTPPSRPPLAVAHPHARRVEMGRWKQGVESRACEADLQRPQVPAFPAHQDRGPRVATPHHGGRGGLGHPGRPVAWLQQRALATPSSVPTRRGDRRGL